jgi:hypothetical protein
MPFCWSAAPSLPERRLRRSLRRHQQARFFTPAQFAVLSEYAETVIPRTIHARRQGCRRSAVDRLADAQLGIGRSGRASSAP